jgi:uncharacterized protein (TIGR02300 family)
MPKAEWGVKRICPTTGKRFYDLNRSPVVSPYTGEVVNLEVSRTRTIVAEKAPPKEVARSIDDLEDDVILEEDEDDVDLNDELLDDDEDDTVSLDDIADVGGEDEEP